MGCPNHLPARWRSTFLPPEAEHSFDGKAECFLCLGAERAESTVSALPQILSVQISISSIVRSPQNRASRSNRPRAYRGPQVIFRSTRGVRRNAGRSRNGMATAAASAVIALALTLVAAPGASAATVPPADTPQPSASPSPTPSPETTPPPPEPTAQPAPAPTPEATETPAPTDTPPATDPTPQETSAPEEPANVTTVLNAPESATFVAEASARITIQKNVTGRATVGDQFRLTVST
ncbi:hypothetical protein GCM10010213_31440 [Microbacterium maritypicum]|uniref:Uncharacterized protein n=2 Tax=Microbacteriaceae TaxID=85023 RepID=A0A4Y4B904_MICMQ|nr:hypothetical protein MLI01_31030 [Microbacterium liquefaciens]GGV65568.1 hypothetical protein GCM10010213_31440 [Microbacterium liquefaciens]